MAGETLSPGVVRQAYDWGFILTGIRSDLIKGGHAQPEWFEDGSKPGRRPGTRCRSKCLMYEGRIVKTHQVRGDRYSVWVEYSAAEVEARARAEQARAAQAALDQALAHLPTSAQAYRAWLDAAAASLMQALWLACRDGHGGYRLATAPHDDALGDAFATLREAIAESRIVFDPAAQARAVIAARSGFAKRDEQLQTFLAAQVKAAGA